MIRKSLVALTILCLAGCDDPEVEEKVLDGLHYGLVTAKATCSINLINPGSWPPCQTDPSPTDFRYVRFIDGSGMITSGWVHVFGASEADSVSMPQEHSSNTVTIESGNIVARADGCSDLTYDIDTYCTGFNLGGL